MNSSVDHKDKTTNDTNFKCIKAHFKIQYTQGFKSMGLYLVFSFVKYLACFWSLRDRQDDCEVNPLYVWLTVVGMYEFLNSIRYLTILYSMQINVRDIFLVLVSNYIRQTLQISETEFQVKEGQFMNRRTQLKNIIKLKIKEIDVEKLQKENPFTSYDIIQQSEALNKYTRIMRIYNQSVYYLVFIGGNAAYIASDNNDCDQNIQKVTFVLLLIGYVFSAFLIVGFGLAILSMGLYIPLMIFLFICRGLYKILGFLKIQRIISKQRNLKLENEKNENFCQCLICMFDYQVGENVVQLQCSVKHNFHSTCLKEWLKIKQQCPVCRNPL